jgi:hypothetical protein
MARIKPNRPGYNGFSCEGITYNIIEDIECFDNKYKQLPPRSRATVTNVPSNELHYRAISRLQGDWWLQQIVDSCDQDFDPFDGTFVDLYTAFIRRGIGNIIKIECFESDESYEKGYLNPNPILPSLMNSTSISVNGGAGGGGGAGGHTGSHNIVVDVDYDETTGYLSYDYKTFTFKNGLLVSVGAEASVNFTKAEECPDEYGGGGG